MSHLEYIFPKNQNPFFFKKGSQKQIFFGICPNLKKLEKMNIKHVSHPLEYVSKKK